MIQAREYFKMLDTPEKIKTLKKVQRLFDRAYYYKTLFKHVNFEVAYPYEYKNIPIGELTGKAKEYNEFLFCESQKMIKRIFDMLTEKQAKKQLNRKKSSNKSTLGKFNKIVLKLQRRA